jgi:hypothetical protein
MKDVTRPVADPFTGGTSFIRAMAKELANIQPFESFSEWEWKRFKVLQSGTPCGHESKNHA